MRALTWFVAILAALWSGYWFTGKSAVEGTANAFFANAAGQGIVAENAGLSVAGFPNRFDLTVNAPKLGDSVTGLQWQAPFLQIYSLSYKPWHVIAALPDSQLIRTPLEDISVTSAKLQASVVVMPSTSVGLDHTAIVGSALTAASTLGWKLAAEEFRFATQIDPSMANSHRIGLDLIKFTPDPALTAALPSLPAVIERVHLDALATLSAPLDRFAGETRPHLTALSLRELSLDWGDLKLFTKGDLTMKDGFPDGRIEIRVDGWRNLPKLVAAMGLIKPEVAPTVERLLETMATADGDAKVLSLPLVFANGRMDLGPLPLGPAPRLN